MAKLTDTIILGDLTVTGTTRFKNDVTMETEINSNFIPDVDGSYSLGTAALRFSTLYAQGIDIEGQITSIDTDTNNIFTLGNSTNASAVQMSANGNDYSLTVNGSLEYSITSGVHYLEDGPFYIRKTGFDIMGLTVFDDGANGTFIMTRSSATWDDSVRVTETAIQLYSGGDLASWNGTNFQINGAEPAIVLHEDDAADSTDFFQIVKSGGNTYIQEEGGNIRFTGYNAVDLPGSFQVKTGGNYHDIWHEGNDGAGSGLDSDTVDGLQASQFLRSDVNDTLSTTGNTTLTIESTFNNSATGGIVFKTVGDSSATRITYQKSGVTQAIRFYNHAATNTNATFTDSISGKVINSFGYTSNSFYGDLTLDNGNATRLSVDGNAGNADLYQYTSTLNSWTNLSLIDNTGVPYLHLQTGSAVTTYYSDFDKHYFRDTAGSDLTVISSDNVTVGSTTGGTNNPNIRFNFGGDLYSQIFFRSAGTVQAKILSTASNGNTYFDSNGVFYWRDAPDGNVNMQLSNDGVISVFNTTGSTGLFNMGGASNTDFGLKIEATETNLEGDHTKTSSGGGMLHLYHSGGGSSSGGDYIVARSGATTHFYVDGSGHGYFAGNILTDGRVRSKDGTVGDVGLGFGADHNVGLIRPASDTISIVTGSVQRVTVDPSGNTGFGTDSPSAMVHAVRDDNLTLAKFERTGANPGNVSVHCSGNNAYIDMIGNSLSTSRLVSLNTGDFQIHTDSTARITVLDTGEVGVGNFSTPTAKLHVYGTTYDGGIFVEDSSTSSGAPVVRVQGQRSDGNYSPSFSGRFVAERFRTDAAINNNSVLGSMVFGGNHTSGSSANIAYPASIAAVAQGTFNSVTDMRTALVFYTGDVGQASLDNANVDFGTEAMRIDYLGNVGIGVTPSSDNFRVAGNVRFDSNLDVYDSINLRRVGAGYVRHRINDQTLQLGVTNTAGTVYYPIIMNPSSQVINFNDENGEIARFSGPDFGIATASPEAKFHVVDEGAGPMALWDCYGAAANVRYRYAGGTASSPTAAANGAVIGNFNFIGYDGTAFPTASATAIRVRTTEAYTPTTLGTQFEFRTNPIGSAGAVDTMILADGGSTIYSTLTIDNTSVSGTLFSLKGDGSTTGTYHGFFSGDYFIVNQDNNGIKFGTNNTTRGEIKADGSFVWNNLGTTIAGATWDNGWFKIGTSGAGWSFDSNEMYNAAAGIIGTLAGNLDLNANDTLNINSKVNGSSIYNWALGGGTPQDNRKLYVFAQESSDTDEHRYGIYSYVYTNTGSATLTADRERTAVYARSQLNDGSTTADTFVANQTALHGYAQITAGHADSMYGIYTLSNVSGGADSYGGSVYGGRFEARIDNAGSGASNMYGAMGVVRTTSDSDQTIPSAFGVRSFLDHDGTDTITSMYLFQGYTDIEATASVSTLYGMHLNLRDSVDGTITNRRGIWVEAPDNETDVRNHIQGSTVLGGNSSSFSTGVSTLLIDDNKATGAGLLVTGGGAGSWIARFERDVGSTGRVDIHSSNGDPTIAFDNGSTGTTDWAMAATSATVFAFSDDSTPSTDPLLEFISGSGMSLRNNNWLYFKDSIGTNTMNIGSSNNTMYLQNYNTDGSIAFQMAGSNTTGDFTFYDHAGTPVVIIDTEFGRQYNYTTGDSNGYYDYYYNNFQHTNGTTTHATYYSSRSSDNNYEWIGSQQYVGVTNTAGSERSYFRQYIMNAGSLLETIRSQFDKTTILTSSGYVEVGAQNTSYCHFQTDRGKFYFNKRIEVNGDIALYADTNNYWTDGFLQVYQGVGVANIECESVDSRARLKIHGAGTGHTTADILLEDDSAQTTRGMGMFMYNRSSGAEWYVGQPYNSDEQDFAICYAVQTNGSEGQATATQTNSIFRLDQSASYLYLGQKEVIRFGDNWLRLNNSGSFTSGIYCGSGVLRTDGTFQVGGSGSTLAVNTGTFSYLSNTIWHAGNDGSGSGLDADTLDGVQGSNYLRSDTSDAMSGSLTVSSNVISGSGSGGVAMTVNDGYGNANLTFNHTSGVPEQAGNAARIEVNTDSTTDAHFSFEIKSNVTAVATSLTQVMTLRETYLNLLDEKRLDFGSSSDMRIHHSSAQNYIDLHSGNLYFRDSTTTRFTFARTTGDFTATGNVTAYSDVRLKNIINVTDRPNLFDNLVVYDYEWKDGRGSSIGPTAQDVQKDAPELVLEDEEGNLSLDYGKYAVAALHESKKRVKQLEEKVEKLESLINKLLEDR